MVDVATGGGLRLERFPFRMKVVQVALGSSHAIAVGQHLESMHVYSWG